MSLLKNAVFLLLASLAIVLVLCPADIARADFGTNLVAYWSFNDNLLDYNTANPHNGTWNGGTETYVAGKFGSAIDLEFDNAQYVQIGGAKGDFAPANFGGGADGTKNMTISLWFTAESFAAAWECLASSTTNNESVPSWRIARSSSSANMSIGGGGDPQYTPPTGTYTDGAWRNLVLVWQDNPGTTSDARMVYIDGQLRLNDVRALSGTQWGQEDMYGSNGPRIGLSATAGRSWDGMIDDVAFWSRALTTDEIAAIWNNGAGASIGSLLTPTYLPGDADRNGTVDGADLNTVLSNYNQSFTVDPWSMGDFDGNGTVDGADLNTVLSNYNQHMAASAAVPEPSTLLLAVAGLAALAAYGRRKRK
jgi:hypothetical protein